MNKKYAVHGLSLNSWDYLLIIILQWLSLSLCQGIRIVSHYPGAMHLHSHLCAVFSCCASCMQRPIRFASRVSAQCLCFVLCKCIVKFVLVLCTVALACVSVQFHLSMVLAIVLRKLIANFALVLCSVGAAYVSLEHCEICMLSFVCMSAWLCTPACVSHVHYEFCLC